MICVHARQSLQNHYKIIESISEEFLAMKKKALLKSSEYALHIANGDVFVIYMVECKKCKK